MEIAQKNFTDLLSLMLHMAVAEKIKHDPDAVLIIAKKNLERWLSSGAFADRPARALLEWKAIIENSNVGNIINIITADTDEGQRLRSSSPFAGVLSETEREEIFKECAEIQPA